MSLGGSLCYEDFYIITQHILYEREIIFDIYTFRVFIQIFYNVKPYI